MQQNLEHTTFDMANQFLLKAIHQYKFQSPPKKVDDFRALVIGEGKENGSKELKFFFKKMDKLLIKKKYLRRLLIKQHQSSMATTIQTVFSSKLRSAYPPLAGKWNSEPFSACVYLLTVLSSLKFLLVCETLVFQLRIFANCTVRHYNEWSLSEKRTCRWHAGLKRQSTSSRASGD